MEHFVTTVENLEVASLMSFMEDVVEDNEVVDADLISDETKVLLLDELLSKLRNDFRLNEIKDCVFTCKKKYLDGVEVEYGIELVDAEGCGYVL